MRNIRKIKIILLAPVFLVASEVDFNYANKTTQSGELTSLGLAIKETISSSYGDHNLEGKYSKDISNTTNLTDYSLSNLYEYSNFYAKASTAKRETKGIDQENKYGAGYSIQDDNFRYRLGLQEVQRDKSNNLYSKCSLEYSKKYNDWKFKLQLDVDRALDAYNTIITSKAEATHKLTEDVSIGFIHDIERETAPSESIVKNTVQTKIALKIKF